jgi:glycosyltransferase involved in cell wall biosynthesis
MRVVTAVNIGYPVVGGAQVTHRTYLRRLAELYGHECLYLDKALTPVRAGEGAPRFGYFRDLWELRREIERARPDVLVGAFTLAHEAVKIGRAMGVPAVAWMNSYEYCPPTADEVGAWRLTQAHRYPSDSERAFALREADRVVVNSRYLRARLFEREGVDAEVIHPSFDTRRLSVGRRRAGEYVLGVCGYPHKGADVFLEIARRLPGQRFMLAGAVHAAYFPEFRRLPNVVFSAFRPIRELLARATLVLVPSQWPEPFGRIAVEAMFNGVPTLVSHAAGLAEIVGGGPHGVAEYSSSDAWVEAVSRLLGSESARADNAAAGREVAAPFVSDEPVERLHALLVEVRPRLRAARRRRAIALAGSTDAPTAFAMINRRLVDGLRERGHTVHPIAGRADFVPEPVEVFVHHDYTQEFGSVEPPESGHFVAVRTWDFGRYPASWVERIETTCDQVWVYSRWTRRQAVLSGIAPGRVRVVPLGVDPTLFRPDGPKLRLETAKAFRFLFVGGAVLRKGVDILLAAYLRAFGASDDVCLVLKDNPKDVFYAGERLTAQLGAAASEPDAPEILHLDRSLSADDVAALYRACTIGVFPYRAEGFALPVLEAMACGTPSLVSGFGACLDFCSEKTSFLLKAKRINLPVMDRFTYNSLGFQETVDEVDFCEVPVETLAERMREVYDLWRRSPSAVERLAARGVRVAHGRFTWRHTLDHVERALRELSTGKPPVRLRRARAEHVRRRRVFEAARKMFLGLPDAADLPVRRRRRPSANSDSDA